jgi:glycyl-tRNA synthetase beta chain
VADLLFELGCEEIPAGYLQAALPALAKLAESRLAELHITSGAIRTLGTPRRLALVVKNLGERQPDIDEELVGPPVSAGDKAKEGFAKKFGLELHALKEADTDKGRRLVARRQITGKPTRELLPDLLGGLIRAIPWPKSMRWGAHPEAFVRPLHWIVALYWGSADGEVVPIEFAGVRSGQKSRGHRFLRPEPFDVTNVGSWISELKHRFVIVDPEEREQLVRAELGRVEKDTGLKVRADEALVREVTNLVEYPVGVCGSFDEQFLEVPEPVIVSAMRGHQRYFAMQTATGRLANRFVTIAGTVVRDVKVVAHGNERVLRSRLWDARFFFSEDRKQPLEARTERLSGVVWVQKLGTMAQKVDRIGALAQRFAQPLAVDAAKATRAARLCKADLLTHLVGEFPDLQGTIGSAYARGAGEDPDVADAIASHYQPRGAQDVPAENPVGALLAICDRADSLVGCFAAGLAPTGSADPFGLRRAALGILSTVLAHNWHLPLSALLEAAAGPYAALKVPAQESLPQVSEFMRGRLRNLFETEFPGDVAEAVLAAGWDDAVDARARLRALATLHKHADFEPLGVAIKRVGNILKGQAVSAALDPKLLKEPAEQALAEAAAGIARRATPLFDRHDYGEALRVLTEFKAPVDAFFEKVFVMDKDERIKENRLALLGSINQLFLRIADFRQLNLG